MGDWPQTLQINAWAPGEDNRSDTNPGFRGTLLAARPSVPERVLAPSVIDLAEWKDGRVGWGIVMAENEALAPADAAHARDAPPALQDLVAKRSGVVLRYRADVGWNSLRRYYDDGRPAQNIAIGANFGTGAGQIPRYLCICAPPSAIPWNVQYVLQQAHFTGRLDLDEAGWERYSAALQSDWAGIEADRERTLVWSVDLGPGDISHLMRTAIGVPLHEKFLGDAQYKDKAVLIDGMKEAATGDLLLQRLAEQPILVATTSHGQTGPLGDVDAMRSGLGCLVDSALASLKPADLFAAWEPSGAIWYAHACCSAGSASTTAFAGVVEAGSAVEHVLSGVAACGECLAPTPAALLGAPKPLRAFIGHVEPTFDWSVRQPKTGQFLTSAILDFLYQNLFTGQPVGMALDGCRRFAGSLLQAAYVAGAESARNGNADPGELLAIKLMALDWRAIVLLGDPTCAIG